VACGGLMARPEAAEKLRPGTHAATFGGNPIACRADLATIETIEDEGLLARAEKIGARIEVVSKPAAGSTIRLRVPLAGTV